MSYRFLIPSRPGYQSRLLQNSSVAGGIRRHHAAQRQIKELAPMLFT
jgi:hypothetical protein